MGLADEGRSSRSSPRMYSARELASMHFPPTVPQVSGLITPGLGLLIGPPKLGKSLAVLDLAIALAGGGVALGGFPVSAPCPVLVLALEDGPRRVHDRLAAIAGSAVPNGLHFVTEGEPHALVATAAAFCREHEGDRPVVFIDTFAKVRTRVSANVNAYYADYGAVGEIRSAVTSVDGAACVVVHHTRKSKGEPGDWLETANGSNGLTGAADYIIGLVRTRGSATGRLIVTGRDVEEAEYSLEFVGGRWSCVGQNVTEARGHAQVERLSEGTSDQTRAIIEAVAQLPVGATAQEVAKRVDRDGQLVSTIMGQLSDRGLLQRLRRGVYCIPRPVETIEIVEKPTLSVGPVATESTESMLSMQGVRDGRVGAPAGCPNHGLPEVSGVGCVRCALERSA